MYSEHPKKKSRYAQSLKHLLSHYISNTKEKAQNSGFL